MGDSEEEDDDYVPEAKAADRAQKELEKQNVIVGQKRSFQDRENDDKKDSKDDADDLLAMLEEEDDDFIKKKKAALSSTPVVVNPVKR